jgi:NAD(P)-dependent dehydrogenase (short-subunit alcohol dehydrogenase family)
VAARINDAGGRALEVVCDVSDPGDVERLFAGGGHHALVNNAGVFSNVLAESMAPEEFMRIQQVNVLGTFLCSQAFARSAPPSGDGWRAIVNVASVDALRPSAEGLVHYTTSKHAVAGLTRGLAMELASRRIRVNAVCPGASLTEGALALIEGGSTDGIDVDEQWRGIAERTPMQRLCQPDEVARAVTFLASELASFVTGVLLPVDGGILVQPLEGYQAVGG